MKLKKLTIACALASAAISGPSFAVHGPATPLNAFDTPEIKVYLSGASAPTTIIGGLTTSLFDNTTAHPIYTFKDAGGKSFFAYFGVIKSGDANIPATLHGKSAMIIDRVRGGSVWGINPVARAQAIQTMDVSATGCTPVTGSTTAYTCNIVGLDPGQVGYPAGGEVVSDFGVSDVAPYMFKSPLNVEFGQDQLTPGESAVLSSFPVNGLLMGLPVTNAVPATTYLSRAAYGAMLSGLIQDWNLVDSTIPVGSKVTVCRRVQGSGTQASYNWFFNNFPCTVNSIAGDGSTPPARMTDSDSYFNSTVTGTGTELDPFVITAADGYTVVENPGSGDVASCLNKAQVGGDHNFKGDDGMFYRIAFGAGGHRAIGVLSLDSSGKENGWKFRTMDGAGDYVYNTTTQVGTASGTGLAPSKFNLREGHYDFAVEVSMQYRNAVVNGVPVLTGDKKTFVDEFIKRAGDPIILSQITTTPANLNQAIRDAVIALPSLSFTPTNTTHGFNVAKGKRGNACGPLRKTY